MSQGWKNGSTRAWRKLRAQVLAQNLIDNKGHCTLATPVCTTTATQVHHTLGKQVTGDDPRYLTATCMPCNLYVGEPAMNPDPPVVARTKW